MNVLFTVLLAVACFGGGLYLARLTFIYEWSENAREKGFAEGYEECKRDHYLNVAPDESVKIVHPLDLVAEMEAVSVSEHSGDDDAGH